MPTLNLTLGTIEIGVILACILYGSMGVQAYNYYQASWDNDSLLVKTLVSGLYTEVYDR